MKDNQYTRVVKEIKAPKCIVSKAVDSIYGAQTESEVISMNKTNITFKALSAIAAMLAVVISLSVILYSLKPSNNTQEEINSKSVTRNFALSVNRGVSSDDEVSTIDEITPEAYVKISEIKSFSSGAHYRSGFSIDENGKYVIDSTRELLSLQQEFTLDMTCTGENIESVTYTAHNSCLAYYDSYAGFISAVDLTDDEIERYDATGTIDYNKWASSCTFDYNCQPKSSWDKNAVVFEGDDVVDGTIPLRISFRFDFTDGKNIEFVGDKYVITVVDDSEDPYELKEIFEEEFNLHADEYALDIIANYKDGTTYTKTLKFKCELEGNFLYLYAIEG